MRVAGHRSIYPSRVNRNGWKEAYFPLEDKARHTVHECSRMLRHRSTCEKKVLCNADWFVHGGYWWLRGYLGECHGRDIAIPDAASW